MAGIESPRYSPRHSLTAAMLLAALLLPLCGCVNSLMMFSRVLMGDPVQTSGFEAQTHVSLHKDKKRVVLHTSAPALLTSEYNTLSNDLQTSLASRLRRRKIATEHADVASRLLDGIGGQFDGNYLARQLPEVDYIFHVSIDEFSHLENSSPNLYRGHAHGQISGYEARGTGDSRQAVEVFRQTFNVSYPNTYPIAIEQTSKAVFIRQFQNHLADRIGASFYDVAQSELLGD